jgi:hypothetical protein
MLIEGKLSKSNLKYAENVKNYYSTKHSGLQNKSMHYWINDEPVIIKETLDILRNSSEIIKSIQKAYPNYIIQPIHNSDEVYISVDPSLRKNSDIALSDCHYDAPFKYIYQCGNIFIRVILALSDNKTTYTTIGNKKSLLDTLDFNGMDYNNDYHCVEGYIPKNNIRILLKLHFLCIHPKSSKKCANFTKNINDWWTHFSRELMRTSIEPKNFYEHFISYIIVGTRTIYNKSNIMMFIIIGIMIFLYKFKSKNKN